MRISLRYRFQVTHADITETRVKTARVLAWDTAELTRQNGERSMWLDGTVYKDLEINMDVKLYEKSEDNNKIYMYVV